MSRHETIAVIPARIGSKRLPKKNIIPFKGKPLIAWTIEAALKCDRFDRILVSTDDEIIANIARDYGLEVPFLRRAAADDASGVSAATIETLRQLSDELGESYSTVVQLMPNCPLRGAKLIDDCLDRFLDTDEDFLITCTEYMWMNPLWAVTLDDEGHPSYVFPEDFIYNRKPRLWCPTGAVWIAGVKPLLECGTFYGPGFTFFPVDWKYTVDIDEQKDLDMAEVMFDFLHRRGEI